MTPFFSVESAPYYKEEYAPVSADIVKDGDHTLTIKDIKVPFTIDGESITIDIKNSEGDIEKVNINFLNSYKSLADLKIDNIDQITFRPHAMSYQFVLTDDRLEKVDNTISSPVSVNEHPVVNRHCAFMSYRYDDNRILSLELMESSRGPTLYKIIKQNVEIT